MAMKAIIMAGGAGTRLQPLTCGIPKPLAPLCGAPVMDYSLRLLRRHGIAEAAATLWYRPRDIIGCFGPGRHGVRLTYVTEEEPVGTAGSVRLAEGEAKDTVLVLSGDGLTDVDLTRMLAFHKSRQAAATLALKRIDIPLPYGVVVTEQDGRIARFIEKPDWGRVISRLVNTGVYLLEPEALALIPADKPFDFGRQLFPRMLEEGLPLYGYESDAYWCDVGDPAAFLAAQADLLAGKTGFQVLESGIRTAEGAMISADSYVAAGARIGRGAVIRRSCVLADAAILPGAQLEGAIVCPRARVGKGARLESGSVLGAGAGMGDFSRLAPGARLWPGVQLPAGAEAAESMRQNAPAAVRSGRAAAPSPARAMQLCAAFMQSRQGARIALMHRNSPALYHLCAGALAAYGAETVWMCGQGTAGLLSHGILAQQADGGLLCREGELLVMDGCGLTLDDTASAALEAAARRQELPAPGEHARSLRRCAALRSAYIRALAREYHSGRGLRVRLQCENAFLKALAQEALRLAGHIPAADGLTLTVTDEAAAVRIDGAEIEPMRQWLLCVRALQRRGEPVYDTADPAPEDIGLLPWDGSEACLRQARLMQDGVAQALLLAELFAQEEPRQALQALPQAAWRQADIPCAAAEKGQVLEALLPETVPRSRGGLSARRGDARAVIRPDPSLPLMHIAVSAHSAEYAQEICDFYAGRVRSAMNAKK